MHILKVTLRQHTPLIHFQHDQEGAILRASEVKPKLDKFILKRLGNGDSQQGLAQAKANGWLIGKGEHPALDYKMRINAENLQIISNPDYPVKIKKTGEWKKDNIGRPLYTTNNYPDNDASLIMSNMGGRIKEEVFNFSLAKNLQLTFITYNQRIEELLIKYLNVFFKRTNFGNRTSKGFGSFEVININGQEVSNEIESDSYILSLTLNTEKGLPLQKVYDVVYKDVFRIINWGWKSLKRFSGVKGKSDKNVLLNIRTLNIGKPDRIPSPIVFKPYLDFWKKNSIYYCDVTFAILFDKDIIKQVTGSEMTKYYKTLIDNLKKEKEHELYASLDKITECEIDKDSIIIEK